MNWDEFVDDDDIELIRPPAGELPLLPASEPGKPWRGMVVSASVREVNFDWAKSEKNPAGKSLSIEVDVDGYRRFEQTVPCHFGSKIRAICAAAGVAPPSGEWSEQQLVGRTVLVETVEAQSKAGNTYVRVQKWLQAVDAKPAEPKPRAPRRTATQKVDAVAKGAAPDDIPF